MNAMIKILAVLAELFTKWQRKAEATKHEAEVQKIEDDPNAWMREHFGGVPKPDAPSPDETDFKHGDSK